MKLEVNLDPVDILDSNTFYRYEDKNGIGLYEAVRLKVPRAQWGKILTELRAAWDYPAPEVSQKSQGYGWFTALGDRLFTQHHLPILSKVIAAHTKITQRLDRRKIIYRDEYQVITKHGVAIPVRQQITVFWLPIATRPADFPPMKFKRGTKFWHIGIIYQSTTYECFNHGRHAIGDRMRIKELERQKMVTVDTTGDISKLTSELTSGTDCATYVARVLGLCTTTGADKGPWWPDDIYTKLTKRR